MSRACGAARKLRPTYQPRAVEGGVYASGNAFRQPTRAPLKGYWAVAPEEAVPPQCGLRVERVEHDRPTFHPRIEKPI